jgi:hypothetical protein
MPLKKIGLAFIKMIGTGDVKNELKKTKTYFVKHHGCHKNEYG